MNQTRTPNRLAREKSPYLLQHAFNPVDWYPWGEEAFARARTDGKPVFLSIGYSTCHWCHVMERESFENEEIAALLNSMFVPVKVDREERPDVDRISMTALQAMGQQGGWPLSMFLTPDLRPFYGGTYFPPVSRYGRAGFPDVLRRIHELWTEKREKVLESAAGIAGFLREISTRPASGTDGTRDPLTGCYEMVRRTYDAASGGFGGGPKFPRPVVFEALLRYHRRTGEPEALMMVTDTLHAIARGGIADHLGGGFHRYAVDSEWRIPHFEKMLYDQAQLATAFLDAHLVTGDAAFAEAARGIFTYVQRDLTHPLGGFTSAEDADSLRPGSDEQGEGAFYVWTRAAVMNELGEGEGALFCEAYGVEEEGNAPFDPQHEFTGLNILYRAAEDEELASSLGTTPEDVRGRLARSRDRLLALRAARPRPLLDDKVITSWNGLMIGAFARGFRVLREPAYREAAVRSARFVRSTLSGDGGKTLFRRWREGEARFEGQLDDYAYLAAGLLELHEATLEPEWLLWAADLARTMVDRFHDPEHGGFFDSPGTDASILARLKESYDGAEPSGNAAAAGVLARLAAMTGNEEWRRTAAESLRFFGRLLDEQPHAMPAMAGVADLMADPPRTAVIAGPPQREDTQLLARLVHGHFEPNRVVLGVEGVGSGPLAALAPFAAGLVQKGGRPTLYLCENFTCSLPVNDPADAARLLQGGLPR